MEESSSCAMCYEGYAQGEDKMRYPRRQNCNNGACEQRGGVFCTGCLLDIVETRVQEEGGEEETGMNCQNCFEWFSLPTGDVERDLVLVAELLPSSAEEEQRLEEEEEDVGKGHRGGADATASTSSSSNLAAFLQTTRKASIDDGADQSEDEERDEFDSSSNLPPARVCSVEGCEGKDLYKVGYCPLHTKRASVASVSAMVNQFQGANLSHVVSLQSAKVELRREHKTGNYEPEDIADLFREQKRLPLGEAVSLIEASRNVFREEKNIVDVPAPVLCVGDLHGQYFDMLSILKKWHPKAQNLLFLGDYVDRGAFSCEVILHLLALKLKYPKQVFLIRGNHECSSVSGHFGFKEECKAKYGLAVYYRFMLAFQTMPIAALVSSGLGNIFACHGGISPETSSLEDIEAINRFVEPAVTGPLCDILWADPMNEDENYKLTAAEYKDFLDADFTTNQTRGCSYMFGYKAAEKFLRGNKLLYMIRAHEVQEEGFRTHFAGDDVEQFPEEDSSDDEGDTDEETEVDGLEDEEEDEDDAYVMVVGHERYLMTPTVLTVFSAPNYCDRFGNLAAVLHVLHDGTYHAELLHPEPHPEPMLEHDETASQLLAMGKTCPYMPSNFRQFFKLAVEMGPALLPVDHTHSETDREAEGDTAAAGPPMVASPPSAEGTDAAAAAAAEDLAATFNASVAAASPASPTESGTDLPVSPLSPTHSFTTQPTGAGTGSRMSCARDSLRAAATASSLSKQHSWSAADGLHGPLSPARPPPQHSETYRKAAARDGINEMHPEVLNQRIGTTKDMMGESMSSANLVAALAEEESAEELARSGLGSPGGPSATSPGDCSPRHPHQVRMRDSRTASELAAMIGQSHIADLLDMQLIEDTESDNAQGRARPSRGSSLQGGDTHMPPPPPPGDAAANNKKVARGASLPPVSSVSSVSALFPSPSTPTVSCGAPSRVEQQEDHSAADGGGHGEREGHLAPSQTLFTHEEIIVLKMLFSLFDAQGKGYISREDFVTYAEEGGDFAQLREVDACMKAIDADQDGIVNGSDYINFAARLKEIHNLQTLITEEEEAEAEAAAAAAAKTPEGA